MSMTPRILVVDDEKWVGSIIHEFLGLNGYDVITAIDLASARRMMSDTIPDLLLLDVMLTDGNGFDFLKELRANPKTKTLPIIIMSAQVSKVQDRINGIKLGADDYLCKPFDLRELEVRIGSLLRRSKGFSEGNQQPLVSNEKIPIQMKETKRILESELQNLIPKKPTTKNEEEKHTADIQTTEKKSPRNLIIFKDYMLDFFFKAVGVFSSPPFFGIRVFDLIHRFIFNFFRNSIWPPKKIVGAGIHFRYRYFYCLHRFCGFHRMVDSMDFWFKVSLAFLSTIADYVGIWVWPFKYVCAIGMYLRRRHGGEKWEISPQGRGCFFLSRIQEPILGIY